MFAAGSETKKKGLLLENLSQALVCVQSRNDVCNNWNISPHTS